MIKAREACSHLDFLGLVGIGIGAFAATDIDDLLLLMLFFSLPSFATRQVISGQYLGIALLIAVSVAASLLSFVVPPTIIGLLGLLPIGIGIKKLIELRKEQGDKGEAERASDKAAKSQYPRFLSVAAVTFSNGGDNIGVYVPLFARSSTTFEVTLLVAVFLAVTAVWCALGYYLVRHRLIAARFSHIAQVAFPFVLIGLGAYILLDPFVFG